MPLNESKARTRSVEEQLAAKIRDSTASGNVVSTKLQTDERVIARVTDGIYRQPGSALRELISNAYDADATRVVVKTDAPRFSRITVEDNGHGIAPEALAHLLLHIGGSAKRNSIGSKLGITSSEDPTRSPGGRRLIGKIGIGLFSVAQLTYTFQIVTKVKGDPYRTVATIALKQYADDEAASEEQKFESGKVNIWREKAADVDAHGTSIVLTNIRPQARDTLRSREIWAAIEQNELAASDEERQTLQPPKYHIGRVDASGQYLASFGGVSTNVPWEPGDDPEVAFGKLVKSVWDEVNRGNPNPKLERIFDYYLRMIWQISLAVPLPYVDEHIFDMELQGAAEAFLLSNRLKGAAEPIRIEPGRTLRDTVGLEDSSAADRFEVVFDNLNLRRPIRFRELPESDHALKTPLVFVGKCREEFSGVSRDLSGGPLDFEAYLFWTPKVAPTEHQGALIRIYGASGTLFDPTFLRYQVSEQTRLRQITCEIFIKEGLDSALNIDRESFNSAHPHVVYITNWLHNALRQLATTQKRLSSEARLQTRGMNTKRAVTGIQQIALSVWEKEMDDPASAPPVVELSTDKESFVGREAYVFDRERVVPKEKGARSTAKAKMREGVLEEKLKAIAQVLSAYGLLDVIPPVKQEELLRAVYLILQAPEE